MSTKGGEKAAKKVALKRSTLNVMAQIDKKADFLHLSFEKYIQDAEKDMDPKLIEIWSIIREDEKKHLKMLRDELFLRIKKMQEKPTTQEAAAELKVEEFIDWNLAKTTLNLATILLASRAFEKPTTQEAAAESEVQLDDMDKKIAKTLLTRGYYETPRPGGTTQEALSKEIGISKPTLEERMRKIESIGLKNLLAQIEFTDEDWDLSWKALQTKIKPKKS